MRDDDRVCVREAVWETVWDTVLEAVNVPVIVGEYEGGSVGVCEWVADFVSDVVGVHVGVRDGFNVKVGENVRVEECVLVIVEECVGEGVTGGVDVRAQVTLCEWEKVFVVVNVGDNV